MFFKHIIWQINKPIIIIQLNVNKKNLLHLRVPKLTASRPITDSVVCGLVWSTAAGDWQEAMNWAQGGHFCLCWFFFSEPNRTLNLSCAKFKEIRNNFSRPNAGLQFSNLLPNCNLDHQSKWWLSNAFLLVSDFAGNAITNVMWNFDVAPI